MSGGGEPDPAEAAVSGGGEPDPMRDWGKTSPAKDEKRFLAGPRSRD